MPTAKRRHSKAGDRSAKKKAVIWEPEPTEVRAAREAVGHTQQHAADAVHVSKRQWQNWESGVHPISLTAWELYCLKTGQPERLQQQTT